MPKYENSIIYKLCHQNDLENNNIYIGSTTNFRTRKNVHKYNCNNENRKEYNYSIYEYIRSNGGWSEWKMIPIEKYPCNGKEELEIRERYHIELLKSKLNKQMPTRTKKQYCEDNKEIISEKKKQYFNANKKILLEKQKEYREQNKEYKKEKAKQYYENNKQIILEKAKEKAICDHCGCELNKSSLKKHQQSKKCLEKQNI